MVSPGFAPAFPYPGRGFLLQPAQTGQCYGSSINANGPGVYHVFC